MSGGQIACVGMPLDVELQSLQAVNRHSIGSGDKGQKVFLLLVRQSMQKLPQISILIHMYLITGVSRVYPPS